MADVPAWTVATEGDGGLFSLGQAPGCPCSLSPCKPAAGGSPMGPSEGSGRPGAGPEGGTILPLFLRPPGARRPRGNEGEPASSPHPPHRPGCQGPVDARAGLHKELEGPPTPPSSGLVQRGVCGGPGSLVSPPSPAPGLGHPCPARPTGSECTLLLLSPPGPPPSHGGLVWLRVEKARVPSRVSRGVCCPSRLSQACSLAHGVG